MDAQGRTMNRIKQRIEDLGIGQLEAAMRADMTQGSISRYACGKITPTVYVALRLADALETTVDYLFNIKDDES